MIELQDSKGPLIVVFRADYKYHPTVTFSPAGTLPLQHLGRQVLEDSDASFRLSLPSMKIQCVLESSPFLFATHIVYHYTTILYN